MPRKLFRLLSGGVLLCTLMLMGCTKGYTYHHFEHTEVEGWEKHNALHYAVPPVTNTADYGLCIDLRTTSDYPYTSITLVVEQQVFPAGRKLRNMVECKLIDDNGRRQGTGIGQYQYRFPIRTQHLNKGDSIDISIKHNMTQYILPGISDVGVRLQQQ